MCNLVIPITRNSPSLLFKNMFTFIMDVEYLLRMILIIEENVFFLYR